MRQRRALNAAHVVHLELAVGAHAEQLQRVGGANAHVAGVGDAHAFAEGSACTGKQAEVAIAAVARKGAGGKRLDGGGLGECARKGRIPLCAEVDRPDLHPGRRRRRGRGGAQATHHRERRTA